MKNTLWPLSQGQTSRLCTKGKRQWIMESCVTNDQAVGASKYAAQCAVNGAEPKSDQMDHPSNMP